jgi:hypothetical protein
MSNQLSRLGDTSVDELKQISAGLQQYLATESEAALKSTLDKIGQKPGLIVRLFPTAIQREEQRNILQRMRSVARANEEMYRLYTDVQLELARKQGDVLIASVGMDLQAKLTTFAAKRIEEITETISSSRRRFADRVKPEFENLKNYQDIPDLYQLVRQSIDEEMKTFFTTLNKLLDGFRTALESKVESFRK